jgi:hypothetical protein
MVMGTISVCTLVIGIWIACRTEEAIRRGEPVNRVQLYAGGILIIGALALLGSGLGNATGSAVPTCGISTPVKRL